MPCHETRPTSSPGNEPVGDAASKVFAAKQKFFSKNNYNRKLEFDKRIIYSFLSDMRRSYSLAGYLSAHIQRTLVE